MRWQELAARGTHLAEYGGVGGAGKMALSHSTQLESEARKGLSRLLVESLGDLVFVFAEY